MRPRPAVAALVLLACVQGGTATQSVRVPDLPPPAITGLKVTCDGEKGAWTFDVTTDAWAGGAYVIWTTGGDYLERHTGFRSIGAAPDGLGDLLRDDVGIVTDFRGYTDGLTAFTCRDAPSGAFVVLGLDRKAADCVRAGAEPSLLDGAPGLPACDRVIDAPEGGDTDADPDSDADTDPDSDAG